MMRTHLGITYVDGQRRAHRTDHKRDLCIMACVFCKDPLFQQWLTELETRGEAFSEAEAKSTILHVCQVASRNELDTDKAAGQRFHDLVRKPFLAWKDEQP